MSENPLRDPLENFLQEPPSLPAESALRDSLLKQTAAMLRKPRWWRRRPAVACIAASILVAIVSVFFALRLGQVKPLP
jgi:hypothetical protein